MGQYLSSLSKNPTPNAENENRGQRSYTFRIQQIEESVTENQILQWLTELSMSISETESNILHISLAPYNGTKTATVTFRSVPHCFQRCVSNQPELTAKFSGIQSEVLVDQDFYGITPLYCSSSNPSFEYVSLHITLILIFRVS
jgi:hypothetical protein